MWGREWRVWRPIRAPLAGEAPVPPLVVKDFGSDQVETAPALYAGAVRLLVDKPEDSRGLILGVLCVKETRVGRYSPRASLTTRMPRSCHLVASGWASFSSRPSL